MAEFNLNLNELFKNFDELTNNAFYIFNEHFYIEHLNVRIGSPNTRFVQFNLFHFYFYNDIKTVQLATFLRFSI